METRSCIGCKNEFKVEQDDFSYYKKIGVDIPRHCPECRAQLRLAFRNERSFYKRDCDKCKKSVVSMYSPNKSDTVWCYDCWFSDDWDGTEYAQEYDSNRPFLDQFHELWKKIPKLGLVYVRSPGSEYTNISADNKNCYMIIESSNNEDSIHSYWIQECRDVIDTSFASKCEKTYECDDCYSSYQLFYSKGCHECRDSSFLFDCRDCSDCLGCVNLRQKKYCIFNKQYTKEEYENKKAQFRLDTHSGRVQFQEAFETFLKTQPRKYAEILNATDSTGNYIKHAKNCKSCFHCYDAEDNKYGVHVWRNAKDCVDVDTAGRNATVIFNSINAGLDTSNQISCAVCWSSTFSEYSMYAMNCSHVFGCVGIRKKNYCILNKQYSKDEYEELRKEIISSLRLQGIYGQFFPADFSCFGYNETPAIEQFPLSKEEAFSKGFKWEETERGTYGRSTLSWENVPDSITEVPDNIVKEIFECLECKKNYRIIQNELQFYKKLSIPLPRTCPECRHLRRFVARGPNRLWHRSCMNDGCLNEFETAYSPEREEVIYCQECYQNEVV